MTPSHRAPLFGLPTRPPIALTKASGTCDQAQQGSVMLQWCIAAMPLLLLGSLIIETSNWHATRQRLALVLQRATHATSMESGTSEALKRYIQTNLASDLRMPIEACITDPVSALMTDFKDHRLSEQMGASVIRHNHVLAQHQAAQSKGWSGGRGPRSGKTIFEANRIHVRLIANYLPKNRWLRAVIKVVPIQVEHRAIMQSHRKSLSSPCVQL